MPGPPRNRHEKKYASDYLTPVSDFVYDYLEEFGINNRLTSVKMVAITFVFGGISIALLAASTAIVVSK